MSASAGNISISGSALALQWTNSFGDSKAALGRKKSGSDKRSVFRGRSACKPAATELRRKRVRSFRWLPLSRKCT